MDYGFVFLTQTIIQNIYSEKTNQGIGKTKPSCDKDAEDGTQVGWRGERVLEGRGHRVRTRPDPRVHCGDIHGARTRL